MVMNNEVVTPRRTRPEPAPYTPTRPIQAPVKEREFPEIKWIPGTKIDPPKKTPDEGDPDTLR